MMTRFIVILCLPALAFPVQEPSAFRVGFAEIDITPKLDGKPVYLAGFGHNRKAIAVHDPIMARAVVLTHGKEKIAIASVDVVGLFLPTVEKIRKQLPGFRYVLVSSTHNHEGPDTLGLWGASPFQSGVDPDYLKRLEEGVALAVTNAYKAALEVGEVRIGTASDPDLLHDGRLPIVKHDELVTLRFQSADKTLGLIVQWNNHPETLDSRNTELSADFVAGTVEYLQKKHACPVLYLTGTVGGLMTSLRVPVKDDAGNPLKDGTFEKTMRYGRMVGELADKAIASDRSIRLTPFEIRTRELFLPLDNKLYVVGWHAGVLSREAFLWTGDPYKAAPIEGPGWPRKRFCVRTELAWLRLGELEVACIPGEIYPELVLDKVQDPPEVGADFPEAPIEPALYKQLRSKYRMIVGLANDEIGYIIPKRQWDEKPPYCYGRKTSQYGEINSLGPETAPILCEAFRRLRLNGER